MKLRFGLAITSALTLALGACAGGGTSSPSGGDMAPTGGGDVLAQGERPRDTDFTRAAEGFLDEEQYQAALDQAQQAIAEDSLNPLAYRLAAEASLGLGDYVMAGAMFDEAERLRPIYALETERVREQAWIDRYQTAAPLVNGGQYEEAISIFEQANAIYQGRPEVMITLGQLYAQVGRYDEAIETLNVATSIIESDKIDEMDEETAADWRAQGAAIPEVVAQSLLNAGRDAEAVAALQELLETDPGNTGYLRMLGAAYVRMEDEEGARGVYDDLFALDGLTSAEYYSVGVGYYQMEDYVAAAAAFKKATDASVNDRDALEMWARSLQIAYPSGADAAEPPAGALDELLGAGQRWLELDPNNQNAYLITAQTANRTGDEDRARELIGSIESLPVVMESVQIQRGFSGGGTVMGSLRNKTASAGASATIEVTFYAADGTVLGVEEGRVQLGEAETASDFQVEAPTAEYVGGYSYRVIL